MADDSPETETETESARRSAAIQQQNASQIQLRANLLHVATEEEQERERGGWAQDERLVNRRLQKIEILKQEIEDYRLLTLVIPPERPAPHHGAQWSYRLWPTGLRRSRSE